MEQDRRTQPLPLKYRYYQLQVKTGGSEVVRLLNEHTVADMMNKGTTKWLWNGVGCNHALNIYQ